MILSSFGAALRQLSDRRFVKVVIFGVALALLLLAAIYGILVFAVIALLPDSINLWWIGPVEGLHTFFGWGALGVMAVLSVFLMVPVAAAFSGIFLDDVAQAVEDRHYPALPPAQGLGLWEGIRASLGLLAVVLLVNIVLLIVAPFTGPFAPLLYFGVNGFLLGREYFLAVAMRRQDAASAKKLAFKNTPRLWIAGVLMALPLAIPLLGLIVPVLGTATFTHLYHRIKK